MAKKEASSKLSTLFHRPTIPLLHFTLHFGSSKVTVAYSWCRISSYLLFLDLKLASGWFSAHLHICSRCFSCHLQGPLVLDARAGDSVVVCVSLIVPFMCLLLCRYVMDYLFDRLSPFLVVCTWCMFCRGGYIKRGFRYFILWLGGGSSLQAEVRNRKVEICGNS